MAVAGFLTAHAAQLGVQVSRFTRADLTDLIQQSVAAGDSIEDLAGKIRERYAGYQDWRAARIARTETASVYNVTSVETYKQAGVVERVEVIDGTMNDEACRAANGAVWSLDYAQENPWQHPNCQRTFKPIVD